MIGTGKGGVLDGGGAYPLAFNTCNDFKQVDERVDNENPNSMMLGIRGIDWPIVLVGRSDSRIK